VATDSVHVHRLRRFTEGWRELRPSSSIVVTLKQVQMQVPDIQGVSLADKLAGRQIDGTPDRWSSRLLKTVACIPVVAGFSVVASIDNAVDAPGFFTGN
jgi:hypothetical protein